MRSIINIFRGIYSVYAFAWFLVIMLLLFPVIVIASFFGKVKGGNFIYNCCRVWVDIWFPLIGIFHRNIYEQPHDFSKQYIFVSNHISFFDTPVMMKAIRKQKFRILGKIEMGKIPIFGFIYRHAVVMVDRSTPEGRAKSVNILRSVLKKSISVFICPEGTFNYTHAPLKNFYDGAFRLAIEMQLPVKPILFLDSYDRMNYRSIFSSTPGRSRAVFLRETETTGLSIDDTGMLKEKIFQEMENALINYKASWIG